MYRVWTATNDDGPALARELETHLNEFAAEIVSVSYAVTDVHHVLAVYRVIEFELAAREEAAIALAEEIVGETTV